jgi:predicted lipoprotein
VAPYLKPALLLQAALLVAAAVSLSGCGVAAFPVRTASAAAKIVPVAGDVVAYPLDKTADVID